MQKHKIIEILQEKHIKDIAHNSKDVVNNAAFFVIKYIKEYLDEAIQKGAKLIISEEKIPNLPSEIENVVIDNIKVALGEASGFLYPQKPKHMIAVTGTSGKSSIVDYSSSNTYTFRH
jgi:UDP-N-acetylmuramyl tripeptide synthase